MLLEIGTAVADEVAALEAAALDAADGMITAAGPGRPGVVGAGPGGVEVIVAAGPGRPGVVGAGPGGVEVIVAAGPG
ncbi:MAG: hypothetical protein Q7R81_00800, partial [Candidatus Peregrinibacteria bacterium]|nr:hypothetical protein [Candidatus Peregrinibacteria bacterium]